MTASGFLNPLQTRVLTCKRLSHLWGGRAARGAGVLLLTCHAPVPHACFLMSMRCFSNLKGTVKQNETVRMWAPCTGNTLWAQPEKDTHSTGGDGALFSSREHTEHSQREGVSSCGSCILLEAFLEELWPSSLGITPFAESLRVVLVSVPTPVSNALIFVYNLQTFQLMIHLRICVCMEHLKKSSLNLIFWALRVR